MKQCVDSDMLVFGKPLHWNRQNDKAMSLLKLNCWIVHSMCSRKWACYLVDALKDYLKTWTVSAYHDLNI